MSPKATLIDQQSAQLMKVKERNIQSICRQQLFHSLWAHEHRSDQKRILKNQKSQTIPSVVTIAYRLWLHLSIKGVLNLTKLSSEL